MTSTSPAERAALAHASDLAAPAESAATSTAPAVNAPAAPFAPLAAASAASALLAAPPSYSALKQVSLDDKYLATKGRVYLSGIQALVRLMLMQRARDVRAGLNTAGFVSGYRGSPLGGLDEALWKARDLLKPQHIEFQPGVNEDLAATAVWGTQQVGLVGPARYDGVFSLWYGKGPGVDRCGDVFKHANHFGTAQHGGVLLVAGDDHGAYSSTLPHQSDHMFAAAMIPMLYPANVEEYITLGLHGYAMSRFSGCYVGFKALADTVESSASINADPFAQQCIIPADFVMPEGGLNARLSSATIGAQARAQEALMQDYKIYAALAYARANRLNHITIDSPNPRLGIIASGKAYLDVLEALQELGIDDALAAQIGLRVFKVAMPWPLEPDSVRHFAEGLEEILVVEEKRQIVEYQLKEQLYNWREDVRPRVIGKFDEKGEWVHPRGEWLLTAKADLSVAMVARVIAARIKRFFDSARIEAKLNFLEAKEIALNRTVSTPVRPAWYCSGCPHNTSTKVPDGSVALAGIGCHAMAAAIYPEHNKTLTHMGGEGVTWVGQAPFCETAHVFANLGDGTYFHSGLLAIRQAIAAKVNITYKILFNDAVAMTGGQPFDGPLSVPMIAHQVKAEGAVRIIIATDRLELYADKSALPEGVVVEHRRELDRIQRQLREVRGTSILIYDQTCAAEKRRRRKKGEYPDPATRVMINDAVCEGCGDCGKVSNCTSIQPLTTPLGVKRTIDQSSCNKDYSCAEGFCPSFVSVTGGRVKRGPGSKQDGAWLLPQPELPRLSGTPYGILITGIGGTGVITVGALLGMAAHLEGRGVSVLDMTGMSQKNGSVMSHVRIAAQAQDIRAVRLASGEADVLIGCDMLTAAGADSISKLQAGRARGVINTHEVPTGHFTQERDWRFPSGDMRATIADAFGDAASADFLDATRIATTLLGDAIATNLFMLGYAWQKGLIPLSEDAILRAIELNGVAIKANQEALMWGRRAAHDFKRVEALVSPAKTVSLESLRPTSLETVIAEREVLLTRYQNAAYAKRYRALVEAVRQAETSAGHQAQRDSQGNKAQGNNAQGHSALRLTRAVAENFAKLMAYKDEYEVARLYTDGHFTERLRAQFDGDVKLEFHLAPPLLARRGADGRVRKMKFGGWMMHGFRTLAKLKSLRGSAFDVFGYTQERRAERALIDEYEADIKTFIAKLDELNLPVVTERARLPQEVRGFGHVKEAAMAQAAVRRTALLKQIEVLGVPQRQAA